MKFDQQFLDSRCKAIDKATGIQCGNHKGHSGPHTRLVATAFLLAKREIEAFT
jgi:hypothetical protein